MTRVHPQFLMDGMKNRKIEYNFRIKNKKVILKWGG